MARFFFFSCTHVLIDKTSSPLIMYFNIFGMEANLISEKLGESFHMIKSVVPSPYIQRLCYFIAVTGCKPLKCSTSACSCCGFSSRVIKHQTFSCSNTPNSSILLITQPISQSKCVCTNMCTALQGCFRIMVGNHSSIFFQIQYAETQRQNLTVQLLTYLHCII